MIRRLLFALALCALLIPGQRALATDIVTPAGHILTAKCQPPSYASIKVGITPDSVAYAWWYCDATRSMYIWRAMPRDQLTANSWDMIRNYYVTGAFGNVNVPTQLSGDHPTLLAAKNKVVAEVDADRKANGWVSGYQVMKLSTSATRPSYAVVNGVRSKSSKTTVAVGTACDCTTKIVEGVSTYCAVSAVPLLVSICSPTSP